MDFKTAVQTCLSKFADFKGRAARSEYWWFYLAYVIAYVVAAVIDGALGLGMVLTGLVALGLLLPMLSAGVRRLHDLDKSGWLLLLGLIPLVGLLLLYWFCLKGTAGDNKYGPDPLAGEAA